MSHGKENERGILDIRYPLCIDEETIIQRINGELGGGGFAITGRRGPPSTLSPPAESPLGQDLACRLPEGDRRPFLARRWRSEGELTPPLGNGVAFGDNLPGRPHLAHQKDEYISVADLVLATRITGARSFHPGDWC